MSKKKAIILASSGVLVIFLVASFFIKVKRNETLLYKIYQYLTYSKEDWQQYKRDEELIEMYEEMFKDRPGAVNIIPSAVEADSKLDRLEGYYNQTEDMWENPDPNYDTDIPFEGREYASFSRYDENGEYAGMGLIDKKGRVRVPPVYDGLVVGFVNGLCEVTKGDKRGLVNEQGVEVVAPQYDIIDIEHTKDIDNNIVRVINDGKEGFIDKQGKVVVAVKYSDLCLVGKNRIMFMKSPQRWGIMDYKGNIICPAQFTHTNYFRNGKTTLQKADGQNYTVYEDGRVEKEKTMY
jgi:hypothetical protein